MAYLYCNPDGVSREFTTVNDALASAVDGDIIMLDPGVYTERVLLDRHVSIRGLTDTPENGDVRIQPPDGQFPALSLNYVATTTSGDGPVFMFECLDLSAWHGVDTQYTFSCATQSIGGAPNNRPSLIFNRCKIQQVNVNPGVQSRLINLNNGYFNLVRFDHCYIKRGLGGGNHFFYGYWTRHVDAEILACELDAVYSCDNCNGDPFPNNYVTTTTSGYGPAYSNDLYIDIPPVGYFDGYVFEESSPVQRTLNLHRRDTGKKVNTTVSNPAGYYYMDTTLSGMHYIVALDAPEDPLYNDLIIGSAYPTPI